MMLRFSKADVIR